jgi:aminopeptidase N
MPKTFALPGARPRYAPDRVVDVEHVRVELDIQFEERRIAGSCAVTLTPILDGVSRVELDAVELDIAAVTRDGAPLQHSYDGRRLAIDFGRALTAGQPTTVVISYAAHPRRGLYFIAPDEGYPQRPRQVW